jgi:hypothetical protein
MATSRARVIYQSEALYVGQNDATGHHFSVCAAGDSQANRTGIFKEPSSASELGVFGYKEDASSSVQGTLGQADLNGLDFHTGLSQLRRVQNANYSFSVNRQDVNQFGQLARIDAVAIDPPTVSLDFSYYLTNGVNEKLLGLNVEAVDDPNSEGALNTKFLEEGNPDGRNFFILTTPQGTDAVGQDHSANESKHSVIALGNGYVSSYSCEASVGGMPTANVSVEGLNLRSYIGSKDLPVPAVNTNYGTPITGVEFTVPPAVSGVLNDSAPPLTTQPTIVTKAGTSAVNGTYQYYAGSDAWEMGSKESLTITITNVEDSVDVVEVMVGAPVSNAAASTNPADDDTAASEIAAAINAEGTLPASVSATASGNVVTLVGDKGDLPAITVGAGQSDANGADLSTVISSTTDTRDYAVWLAGSSHGFYTGGQHKDYIGKYILTDSSNDVVYYANKNGVMGLAESSSEPYGNSDYWSAVGASGSDPTPSVLNDSQMGLEKEGWSCLRPGDITLKLGTNGRAGLMERMPAADPIADYNAGSCHVQSFSIDLPVGRSPLQRLGTPYGYTRVIDFPVTITINCTAILADLKEGNVADLLFEYENHDLEFTLREPHPYGIGDVAMKYIVKGAQLEGESFSSSIGDNKTVDITWTAQVGGPEDETRGIHIQGSRNALTIDQGFALPE